MNDPTDVLRADEVAEPAEERMAHLDKYEVESLRATVARLERERDSLARRCGVRFEETQAALDVIRWLRAGRKPDLDAGVWWRNDLRVSWPMADAHRGALRAALDEETNR